MFPPSDVLDCSATQSHITCCIPNRPHMTPKRCIRTMRKLEPLQTVTPLCLLPDHIHHRIRQLGALGVVPFSPDIARTAVGVDKGIGPEQLSVRARAHKVEHAGLEVDLDGAGDVFRV